MDKFEEKVISVLDKLETEGLINPETPTEPEVPVEGDKTEKELIDPMKFDDTAEVLEAKKQKWMDIFNLHPDLADNLIALISYVEEHKEIDGLNDFIQKVYEMAQRYPISL